MLRRNSMNAATVIELTSKIVSAYISRQSILSTELPSLILSVHRALTKISMAEVDLSTRHLTPAVPIKDSVTPTHIICLENGKKFKSLKRHLRNNFNLSPAAYREKWKLPHDYPMIAPDYAAVRSEIARKFKLGHSTAGDKNRRSAAIPSRTPHGIAGDDQPRRQRGQPS